MPGPELVVVRDHPVHRVPDDQDLHGHSDDQDDGDDKYEGGHQLGHVVGLPDAPGHARGVEVAGRLLHGDLAGQQGGHLVYVPLQALTQ